MLNIRLILLLTTSVLFKCVGSQGATIRCNPDETYMSCGSACPLTCTDPIPGVCNALCVPGCFCRTGTIRDESTGRCVLPMFCRIFSTIRCNPDETYMSCGSACPLTCTDPIPGNCIALCVPGCFCRTGTIRDESTGRCVLPQFCPASLRCGINKVAVECASTIPQTCESVYTTYKPVGKVPCKPGCDCRPGYLMNKWNICVPSEFCPTVPQNQCGPNQEYKECGSACAPSCADLGNPNQICTDQCVAGCFCKDGYLKDGQGNCIPRDQCPLPVCTQPNEVATDCGSACNDRNCEDYKRTDIVCAAVCIRGCFCAPGYVRNAYGICIPPDQCPPQPVCLQANEEYQSCGSSCPDNCDNYLDTGRICTANCVPGCNCKAGFVRNLKDKTCVKPEQCLPQNQCGLNQEYKECGSACAPSCANLDNPNQICTDQCVAGCFCKNGYLKDGQGNCIPRHQCPLPVCTQPNEVATDCGSACNDRNCDNYKRTDIGCAAVCIRGCFCTPGYVRNAYGVCIPPDQCPNNNQTCSDPNAERVECATQCPPTCANPIPGPCIASCKLNECVCKTGFILSEEGGKCVPVDQCPT